MPPKRKATSKTDLSSKKQKTDNEKQSNEAIIQIDKTSLKSDAETKNGEKWNLKISSWNVNGVRAWVKETKCDKASLPPAVEKFKGYKTYWLSGEKSGYSGTALFSKTEPIKVSYGIGIGKHDKEGRVITAEYDKFYFVTTYVPNAGQGLPRLGYRTKEWDVDFTAYLKKLDQEKPVIMCGDLNVAHQEIDLSNPKTNTKSAGFTPEERLGFTNLLNEGFIDTFRHLYPDMKGSYSYWNYMNNARAKDIGWRLDYFVISDRLKDSLCDSVIRKDIHGSDHCPVVLLMHI